ncbi:helix-turn-helix transcriptional regulator [Phytoactinopolyspora halotolerans]|uniref:Helix-turn-helix domain-containing protein n=1 Tax=Phytoactinopolyspora halotolerans TaxID=1981512 RepID=A0A6L9SKL7_9ACTN|nr:helix-turn-helix transcriptional regulator [Phytoactinopolyspora halotolerans]NEE04650.1 helix-turn-helix domain-containing protein [Phytoactinopolyspora halotolerans]
MTASSIDRDDHRKKSRELPGTGGTTFPTVALERRTELADFLTRRRAALRPTDVGLAEPESTRRRRTPGLRREEVAMLAGVSVDWYIRLEQGRAERPSSSVLDALSRALRLTADERAHLYALARAERPPLSAAPRETPDASLQRTLTALPDDVPAMVLGRKWDVLASNHALHELLVPFDQYPAGSRNLVELTFLDPALRDRYVDWADVASETVANFRASVARHLELPDVQQLVHALSTRSPDFAARWADHQVREKSSGTKRIRRDTGHAVVYQYDTLLSPANPDQRLVTYAAA